MKFLKTKTGKILSVFLFVILISGGMFHSQIWRIYKVLTLFDRANIVENFRSMNKIFDTRIVHRAGAIDKLKFDLKKLPATYLYKGKIKKTNEFLEKTWTTGMIIVKGDTVVYEKYFRGNNSQSKVISWSVAKSFLSALFGIAIDEGYITNINQKVTDYVPFLKGSGYDGVRIKDVLQMSSGIRFNEDYGDFDSDINRMGRLLALNTSIDDFVASLKSERKAGVHNHYVSMDTQVLGMILREAISKNISGKDLKRYKNITTFMEEKLWKKIGMESDAYWALDNTGMELVFGGLNAVLRDYAHFGLLYLHNGVYKGKTIVSSQWIHDSVTPDAPYLMPGRKEVGEEYVPGYGYQWWIPEGADGDFIAIGIYNQYIWINPKEKIVIVKSSAYPDYNIDGSKKTVETIALFKKIARYLFKNK